MPTCIHSGCSVLSLCVCVCVCVCYLFMCDSTTCYYANLLCVCVGISLVPHMLLCQTVCVCNVDGVKKRNNVSSVKRVAPSSCLFQLASHLRSRESQCKVVIVSLEVVVRLSKPTQKTRRSTKIVQPTACRAVHWYRYYIK